MPYIDKRLLKLSKQNGKFVKLDVGDTFQGVFLTWKAVRDEKYNKIKPVYLFKTSEGEEKQLSTGAKSFGSKMARVIPGSLVAITRLGEGQKTDYSLKVLKAAEVPQDIDDPLDEPETLKDNGPALSTEGDVTEDIEDDDSELFA